jgi:2',3'-cyclic-nucleotide 2'-phosphodiesterase (5'-nucleotidase family)
MKKLLLFSLLLASVSEAKLLTIIHTNDLHSYFIGYQDGRGGYARVKSKIDELKAESQSKGIDTLILDGGDFGEGTSFFLSNDGSDTIKALEIFGTEASVLGNHDYMQGGNILAQQITKANVKTKIISANLIQTPEMGLQDLIKPYADFEKSGIKIRVIGLSTMEPHFQYAISPGLIDDPIKHAIQQSEQAKKDGRDLVIALTHLGVMFDRMIVQNTKHIDLVVGGHSHTRLDEALYQKNDNKKPVPIVQAASHGLVVGKILIDYKDDGTMQIVEYKLFDIKAPMPEEQQMVNFVEQAKEHRNALFGGRFDDVIGYSDIKLSGYEDGHAVLKKTCWGEHMARIAAQSSKADIGVHMAFFEGMMIPPGPIKLGDLVDNFPHIRRIGDMGWEISSFEISGKNLIKLLKGILAIKNQMGFSFHGLDYNYVRLPENVPYVGGVTYSWALKINGKRIDKNKKYRIAFPNEVAHAVRLSLPDKLQKIFPGLEQSGKFFWTEMENYVKVNSPIKCLTREF